MRNVPSFLAPIHTDCGKGHFSPILMFFPFCEENVSTRKGCIFSAFFPHSSTFPPGKVLCPWKGSSILIISYPTYDKKPNVLLKMAINIPRWVVLCGSIQWEPKCGHEKRCIFFRQRFWRSYNWGWKLGPTACLSACLLAYMLSLCPLGTLASIMTYTYFAQLFAFCLYLVTLTLMNHSFSMTFSHFSLGHPVFLLSWGIPSKLLLATLVWSIVITLPTHSNPFIQTQKSLRIRIECGNLSTLLQHIKGIIKIFTVPS